MKRNILKKIVVLSLFILGSWGQSNAQSTNAFVFLEEEYLEAVKAEIEKGNDYFVNARNRAISSANNKLSIRPNPVTRKSQVPPSGDKHDYISIAPYLWPDPSKPNGLPWIGKDGQINPDTRGDATDLTRAGEMMRVLLECGMALYFSDDDKYARKIKEHLNAWFIDPATKMNPNLNFAQSHPGKNDGNWYGIIEFGRVDRIINTIQIMEQKNKLSSSEMASLKAWFTDYVNWLETSDFGKVASNSNNNHAVWFHRQVIGLNLFLGKESKAKSYVNDVKSKIIQKQIEPDGSMPHELKRTKSIDYTATNIEGFIDIAKMAEKMGVNLWGYKTSDGRSIPKTIDFTLPYIKGEKTWQWQDIKYDTPQQAFEKEIYPLLSKAGRMFDTEFLPKSFGVSDNIGLYDILTYPPLDKLQLSPKGYTFAANEKETITITRNVDIAFGANGKYVYLTNQTSDKVCDATTFGSDPVPGVVKICYIRVATDYTPPAGYTLASSEKEMVNVSGSKDIAFGADGKFEYLHNQTTDQLCSSESFGSDPVPGVVKKCFVRQSADYTPPSGYTDAVGQNKTIIVSGKMDLAYGANGSFEFLLNQEADVECNKSSFGDNDPAKGYLKRCYTRPSADYTPPFTYSETNTEGQTVSISGKQDIAYGANGSFEYLMNQTSDITCYSASFRNEDPAKGYIKRCFTRPSADFTPPEGYSLDANENMLVDVIEPMDIAFGVNGKFEYLFNQTDHITCNTATFGNDPEKGYVKKCYVRLAVITSLNNTTSNLGLSVFPNPSHDGFFHLSNAADWEVVNLNGELISQGNSKEVNLSNQQQGKYLLKTDSEVLKLIKQ